MKASDEKPFLDDLNLSRAKAWDLLARGRKDRHSPMHTLVVASSNQQGAPSQRVMVLRSVEIGKRVIRFNSDRRAAKVDQIAKSSLVSVLGYHPEAKIQLRMSGTAEILTDGIDFENAWDQASPYGKRCYLASPGPGQVVKEPSSGLMAELEGVKPTSAQLIPAKQNFAILEITVSHFEWLYLAHTGHRRAAFAWNEQQGDWDGEWLIP